MPKLKPSDDVSMKRELAALLNAHCIDSYCNMPDYVLADFLARCLETLAEAVEDSRRHAGVGQ